ncbi:MAG: C1 family peptidase [Anaerolineales bacterium]
MFQEGALDTTEILALPGTYNWCDHNGCTPVEISDWAYVGTSSSVPATSAIKQAIYGHGPVAAAVCVNTAFQNYGGGVSTGPGCTSVNHAIVLVGWDDVHQAWILRNSWGPNWGENGYMRIGYGVSEVGYSANYTATRGAPDLRRRRPPPLEPRNCKTACRSATSGQHRQ